MSIELNELARLAIDYVNTSQRHIFLTGKAGTGKTTLLRHIVETTHKNTIVAAPTGIAAINAGGVTLHSLLQLPFGTFVPQHTGYENQYQNLNSPTSVIAGLRFNAKKIKLLRELELLIIDEVSMLRADLLDCADLILRHVRRKRSIPFGGIQILFIGDLNQLPPVVKNGEWPHLKPFYSSIYFFEAHALTQSPLVHIELEKIYRQTDFEFIKILNNLREGRLLNEDVSRLNQHHFPDKADHKKGYIHITTHNSKANQINETALQELKNEKINFTASLDGDFPEHIYPIDQELAMKKGAQVMFIKNDPTGEQKFFNGKIGQITEISESSIQVTCENDKYPIYVTRYTWTNNRYELNPETNEIEETTIGTFEQYPLRLAWAITVHKSQGLTFEKAILDLNATFAPGQLYVALSRLTSLSGLILSSPLPSQPQRIDRKVSDFSERKMSADSLKDHLTKERKHYVFDCCIDSYDFTETMQELTSFLQHFNKGEGRSVKQKYKPFHMAQLETLKTLKSVSDKFIQQIQYIYQTEEEKALTLLLERMNKAEAYFTPKFEELTQELSAHKEKVKTQKAVKAYMAEIQNLLTLFHKFSTKTNKATLILTNAIDEKSLNKEVLHNNTRFQKQQETFKQLIKDEKIPTREISFNLFRQGLSIAEIAQKREMVEGTIEGHLAEYVLKGEIEVGQLVESEKVDAIMKVIEVVKEGNSSDIKAKLGDEYTYGEIKIVRAHLTFKASKQA